MKTRIARILPLVVLSALFFSPLASALGTDLDDDGLTDADEVSLYHTNPYIADTDGDGVEDGEEVKTHFSDPLSIDTDNDGLYDGEEANTYKTSLILVDTDFDGLNDGVEVNTYRTDPIKADTDGDLLDDGLEVYAYRSNPLVVDTDGDGLSDSVEVNAYGTDPIKADSDGDGVNDKLDYDTYHPPLAGTDTDADGLIDVLELYVYHTDPDKADSDGDGLSDGQEVNTYHADPTMADTDSDGVDDLVELNVLHTDPTRSFDMHAGTSTIPFNSSLVSGSYEGLVYDPASGLSLKHKLTISSNGSFSASIMGLPKDASYKGKFTSLGEASMLLNAGSLVSVQMNVEKQGAGDYYIHGVFTTKMNTNFYFELHRSSYSRSNPYPHPGKVTFAASLDTAVTGPEGHAVATGEIRSDGTVVFSAYLPDGSVSSYSGPIVNGNLINLYTRSNAKSRTTLIGVLVIRDIPATSDFDGSVRLFSTVELRGSLFPLGFDQARSLEGSYYTPPSAGTLPLPSFMVAPNNALYRWIGGTFAGVNKIGTWSTDGRMVIPATPIDSAKATFTASSGLLTLSYRAKVGRGPRRSKFVVFGVTRVASPRACCRISHSHIDSLQQTRWTSICPAHEAVKRSMYGYLCSMGTRGNLRITFLKQGRHWLPHTVSVNFPNPQ